MPLGHVQTNYFLDLKLLRCNTEALDVTAKFYNHGIRGVNVSQSIGRMSVVQNDPYVPLMCLTSHPHLKQIAGEEAILMPNKTQTN